MNRRSWLIVAVLLGLSCGLGSAQEPAKQKVSNVGDLNGQIIAITLMSDVEDLVLLSSVSEKPIAGKAFLRGDGVDDGKRPTGAMARSCTCRRMKFSSLSLLWI